MSLDQVFWFASRTAALTAFVAVAAALVTGQALRTSWFAGWIGQRDLVSFHRFLTVSWLPLIGIHVTAIVADGVAHLSWVDVFVPFRSPYAALPIGLGTIAFDLLVVVTVFSYMRRQLSPFTWRWLHRMTYPMFGLFFLHALLAGSDLAQPLVAAMAWGTLAFAGILTVARLALGRVEG